MIQRYAICYGNDKIGKTKQNMRGATVKPASDLVVC
jgi:hypothetical protein